MSAEIVIDPSEVLVDEPVAFTVEGCAPGEPVALSASSEIGQQRVRTEAHFVAPAKGVVEPATQPISIASANVSRCRSAAAPAWCPHLVTSATQAPRCQRRPTTTATR